MMKDIYSTILHYSQNMHLIECIHEEQKKERLIEQVNAM